MKKLSKSISQSGFRASELYLDDIRSILTILGEVSSEIQLQTPDIEFESLDDLAHYGNQIETIHDLTIKSRNPYLTVDLGHSGISLYFADDTLIARGAAAEIRRILEQRPQPLWWLGTSYATSITGGVTLYAFWWLLLAFSRGQPPGIILGIAITLLGVLLLLWEFSSTFRRFSTIVLKFRSDRSSFWQRNRDQILVVLVTAIVTAVATFAATYAAFVATYQPK